MEVDHLDSLPWKHAGKGDDSFSLIYGGVEGGFITLEEIDESEYGFIEGTLEGGSGKKKGKSSITFLNSKKRKRGSGGVESEEDHSCLVQEGDEKEKKAGKKRKRKKRKTKVSRNGRLIAEREENEHAVQSNEETCKTNDGRATDEEPLLHEDEVCAWNELRLHPLLMRSIRRLGFREPTPIQKSCIPIAAHQGKDVIGAAQTGSGKTLAFGLPILQRILEEREKAKSFQNHSKDVNESSGERHLRALILAPTRELALQVSDHLKKVSRDIDVRVVPIVGGMYAEKQERLLKKRPEIVVGTPGRLWELMSGGNEHLVQLHLLSFFVLDEADRMIETGHFKELQSIIDILPIVNGSVDQSLEDNKTHITIPNLQQKKRQTFVFSATIALSENFRKKLKRTPSSTRSAMIDGLTSIEKLSERAGMRSDVAIIDLTHASIVADKLVESFIKSGEEDKEAYLYYILSVHRAGRTIVFCTSIAALRRISSLLHLLDVSVWTLHAQMQQRARLKAMDRFRDNEHGVLIATDVAARGLDIPGIRTVVHYQLPHSAEVYIHRSGRTARASADGCSIALISPSDQVKFSSLCKSLSKDRIHEFYVDNAYMTDLMRRLSLARQIDKVLHKNAQENVKKNWFERNALSVEVALDDTDSEEERVTNCKQKKISSFHLKKLQQELNALLARPLQPKAFSHRFFAGSGVSSLLQKQLEELSKAKSEGKMSSQEKKKQKLVVIGQDCIEPLQALRISGHEVCVNVDKRREKRRQIEKWKNQRRQDKKREREQKRKERKRAREGVK